MRCKTCIVQATCTKNHYEGSLCEAIFKKMSKRIERLRSIADKLEIEYGLIPYFFEKKHKEQDIDPVKLSMRID